MSQILSRCGSCCVIILAHLKTGLAVLEYLLVGLLCTKIICQNFGTHLSHNLSDEAQKCLKQIINVPKKCATFYNTFLAQQL